MNIILASSSKRRIDFLKELFDEFQIMPQSVDENICEADPIKLVTKLADLKLNGLDKIYKDSLIISADTIVYFNNKEYGKPKDYADAFNTLKTFSGKYHEVYTGVCVYFNGVKHLFYDKSEVEFKDLTDEDIDRYIKTKNPFDKAGSYGIQDKEVVKTYKGSYTNIVGLPMEKLKDLLTEIGVY